MNKKKFLASLKIVNAVSDGLENAFKDAERINDFEVYCSMFRSLKDLEENARLYKEKCSKYMGGAENASSFGIR